jgi:phage/plasmid-like protein (TIGR03299 family)
MINGEAAMAFTGDRNAVWHRLGKQVPNDLSPEQMMKAAQCDWNVLTVPLTADIPPAEGDFAGTRVPTGHQALVRDCDLKVLDVVTEGWNPVQNSEAFEFFKDFIDAGDMQMDTAGSLHGGRVVWALAKICEGFTILGGDRIEGYLLFTNPHQFGRSVNIAFTPVRVVCNNTLTYALANIDSQNVRHSHRTEFDPVYAKQVLGITTDMLSKYKANSERLASIKYDDRSAKEFLNRIFPVLTTKRESRKDMSKSAERCLDLLNNNSMPGSEFEPGSLWQLFNSVTYVTSNEYGRTDEARMTSLFYGQNKQRNLKAMDLIMKMADELEPA